MAGFLIKCLECEHEMVIVQLGKSIAYSGEIEITSNETKTEFACDMCGNKVKEEN